MAKDPAFLFYPGDWQGGTTTMSRHLKGCYLDLLIAQFNSGPLSLEEIKIVLGTDFAAWGSLSKKFAVNTTGKYFNERLEAEKSKRANFSNKQKERVFKRWNKNGIDSGNTVVLPIENENRNENEISSFGKSENLLKTTPKIEEVERVFIQQGGTKEMAHAFFNRYEAVEWKIRGTPVKNFAPLIPTFITNWKENKNGNSAATNSNKTSYGQSAGAINFINRIKAEVNK